MILYDKIINLDCTTYNDKIFFITDNNEKSIEFIQKLSQIKQFSAYSDLSVTTTIFAFEGTIEERIQKMKNIIFNLANKMELKVNFLNTTNLSSLAKYVGHI